MQTEQKRDLIEQISYGLGSRGLRLKLLTQASGELPSEVIRGVNQITTNYNQDSIVARTLACRIIASAMDANGVLTGHNPSAWNLGSSALAYAKQGGSTAYNHMLKRLVRCCSLPLTMAVPHIYSLAELLLSKDIEVNFTRLYWDLYNWECPTRNIPLAWATAFCDLRHQNNNEGV